MLLPMGTPQQEALELLASGSLREAPGRAWTLFEEAWGLLDSRLGTYVRSFRLAEEFREDCGQNTLLRVWRAREDYRGHSLDEFYAWMYRIARHEAQRLTDRAGRGPLREADARDGTGIEDMDPGGVHDMALGSAESAEQSQALEGCMQGLENRQRELVELLYGPEPATERAVAMMLEISKTHVNNLRHAALDALALCLKQKGIAE
ncbi:MAG: RNA polymerase sigma factor (sigma-70 family) [Candidatus Paceibacteria bacterium]|jgi:RNA polymerase sigma factor (sigma-70 family)